MKEFKVQELHGFTPTNFILKLDSCFMVTKTAARRIASKIDETIAISAPIIISGVLEKLMQRKRISYSSFGEDLMLESIFKRYEFDTREILKFSYIDVGAWRPIRGSNTYKMYKQGIYGTVVEPNSNLSKVWRAVRPKDQFLPYACSNNKEVEFHQFTKLAQSNTANKNFAQEISTNQNIMVTKSSVVKALNLDEIIAMHLNFFPGNFILDLDIEGDDSKVLESFSFAQFLRPSVILVEDHFKPNLVASPIHSILSKNAYQLTGRTTITSIYVDSHSTLASSLYPIV